MSSSIKIALVVDDEKAVRKLVCRALEQNGWKTVQAESAGEALHLLGSIGSTLSLVITDNDMEYNGAGNEVVEAVDRFNNVPVIHMTGGGGELHPNATHLRKPFAVSDLLALVR